MKEFITRIDGEDTDLRICRVKTEQMAAEMGFTGNDLGDIVSAVFEACINAVTHGSSETPNPVTLRIIAHPNRFEAVVKDSGKGFTCPVDTPVPSATTPRGRGIPLMRTFMDHVHFEYDGGCKVTLVKYLPRRSNSLAQHNYTPKT